MCRGVLFFVIAILALIFLIVRPLFAANHSSLANQSDPPPRYTDQPDVYAQEQSDAVSDTDSDSSITEQSNNGIAITPYVAGFGTDNKPLLISSATQLVEIRDLIEEGNNALARYVFGVCPSGDTTCEGAGKTGIANNKSDADVYLKLRNDIDLINYAGNEGWKPIGTYEHPAVFKQFDGGGFKIDNLTINRHSDYQGLFGVVDDVTIQNVSITSGSVKGGNYTGSLVGYVKTRADIKNVFNLIPVSGTEGCLDYGYGSEGDSYGEHDSYTPNDSYSSCDGYGGYGGSYSMNIGGIVGYAQNDISITNAYNKGAVQIGNAIGGILGGAGTYATISNVYNAAIISGKNGVGGILGYSGYQASISNSLSLGEYIESTKNAGRIYGQSEGSVTSINNYGLQNMRDGGTICGILADGDFTGFLDGNNSQNGADITWGDINTATKFRALAGLNNWSADDWSLQDGKLPLLKSTDSAHALLGGQVIAQTIPNDGVPPLYITSPGSNYVAPFGHLTGASGTYGESETNPFTISTPSQLALLSCFVNSGNEYYNADNKYYQLTADIDLSAYAPTIQHYKDQFSFGDYEDYIEGGWTPIGTWGNRAQIKQFDGANHTISSLQMSHGYRFGSPNEQGLFGAVDNIVIKNLNLAGGQIRASGWRTGAFVGYASDYVRLENVTSSVRIILYSRPLYVGGLIGESENISEVINSSHTADIVVEDAADTFQGGIIGHGQNIRIVNSYNSGDIYEGSGLIGFTYYTSKDYKIEIINSYNSGNIIGTGSFPSSGLLAVNGLLSGNKAEVSIINSYNTGNAIAAGLLYINSQGYNSYSIKVKIHNSLSLGGSLSYGDARRVWGSNSSTGIDEDIENNYALESMRDNSVTCGKTLGNSATDEGNQFGTYPAGGPYIEPTHDSQNGKSITWNDIDTAAKLQSLTGINSWSTDDWLFSDSKLPLVKSTDSAHSLILGQTAPNYGTPPAFITNPGTVTYNPFGRLSGATGTYGESDTNPFTISTPEQLALLGCLVESGDSYYNSNNKYYQLTADIDLSGYVQPIIQGFPREGGWKPIGNVKNPTRIRQFDGNGHKITNMKIFNTTNTNGLGLFGDYNGSGSGKFTIKNLSIENSIISDNRREAEAVCSYSRTGTGGFLGTAIDVNTLSIENSNSHIDIKAFTPGMDHPYGGFVGKICSRTNSGVVDIHDVTTTSPISIEMRGDRHPRIGGLIGDSDAEVKINNAYNTGDLKMLGSSHAYIGGAISSAYKFEISNFYNTGNILTRFGSIGGIVGNDGGVAGGEITNSYNTGEIMSYSDLQTTAGGLVGYSSGDNFRIINSISFARMVQGSDGMSGRIVGHTEAQSITLQNNYALSSTNDGSQKCSTTGKNASTTGSHFMNDGAGGSIGAPAGDNKNGADITWDDINTTAKLTALTGISNWSTDDWLFQDGKLPLLRLTAIGHALLTGQNAPNDGTPPANVVSPDTAPFTPFGSLPGATGTYGESETNPFTISTTDQLALLACLVNRDDLYYNANDKYYQLTADIDLSTFNSLIEAESDALGDNDWAPIGLGNGADSAIRQFDGGGHIISNLKFDRSKVKQSNNYSDFDFAGLFGYTRDVFTIKNLTLNSCEIYSNYAGGFIAGAANELFMDNVHSNCKVEGEVSAGGLIGASAYVHVYNSSNTGNISIKSYDTRKSYGVSAGGIIGQSFEHTGSPSLTDYKNEIINTYNTGNITSPSCAGGIVGGFHIGDITVKNTYNTGNIAGADRAAGIIGEQFSAGLFENVYNTGQIASGSLAGGIIAHMAYSSVTTNSVHNAYNTGNVIIDVSLLPSPDMSMNGVGGIVGYSSGSPTITNSLQLGKVVAKSDVANNGLNAVGRIVSIYSVSSATLENNYSLDATADGSAPCGDINKRAEADRDNSFGNYYGTHNDTDLNDKNGKNITWNEINTTAKLTALVGISNWSTDDWIFQDGKLPLLKSTTTGHAKLGGQTAPNDGTPPNYLTNPSSSAFAPFTAITGATGIYGESETNPFAISTADQLATLACLVNTGDTYYNADDKYYQLTADIDLTDFDQFDYYKVTDGDGWMPIGNDEHASVIKQFNGAGHKISNLSADRWKYAGLFGRVEKNLTIKNLGIIGGKLNAIFAGSLVAYGSDVDINISNTYNTADIVAIKGSASNPSSAGGLVGAIYASHGVEGGISYINDSSIKITSSYNVGTVSGRAFAGGLVGAVSVDGARSSDLTIKNSYNIGTITSTEYAAGGLVGNAWNLNTTVLNSYNTGNVYAVQLAGGILGSIGTNVTVKNCLSLSRIISGFGWSASRIINDATSQGGTIELSNNYALIDQMVNGQTIINPNAIKHNTVDGANITRAELAMLDMWKDDAMADIDASGTLSSRWADTDAVTSGVQAGWIDPVPTGNEPGYNQAAQSTLWHVQNKWLPVLNGFGAIINPPQGFTQGATPDTNTIGTQNGDIPIYLTDFTTLNVLDPHPTPTFTGTASTDKATDDAKITGVTSDYEYLEMPSTASNCDSADWTAAITGSGNITALSADGAKYCIRHLADAYGTVSDPQLVTVPAATNPKNVSIDFSSLSFSQKTYNKSTNIPSTNISGTIKVDDITSEHKNINVSCSTYKSVSYDAGNRAVLATCTTSGTDAHRYNVTNAGTDVNISKTITIEQAGIIVHLKDYTTIKGADLSTVTLPNDYFTLEGVVAGDILSDVITSSGVKIDLANPNCNTDNEDSGIDDCVVPSFDIVFGANYTKDTINRGKLIVNRGTVSSLGPDTGSCSIPEYTNKADCENGGGTWTPGTGITVTDPDGLIPGNACLRIQTFANNSSEFSTFDNEITNQHSLHKLWDIKLVDCNTEAPIAITPSRYLRVEIPSAGFKDLTSPYTLWHKHGTLAVEKHPEDKYVRTDTDLYFDTDRFSLFGYSYPASTGGGGGGGGNGGTTPGGGGGGTNLPSAPDPNAPVVDPNTPGSSCSSVNLQACADEALGENGEGQFRVDDDYYYRDASGDIYRWDGSKWVLANTGYDPFSVILLLLLLICTASGVRVVSLQLSSKRGIS